MKKVTKVILASVLVLATVGVTKAQSTNETSKSETKRACFVDANQNGTCDKYEDGTCTIGNGKGLRNGSGYGKGKGLRNGNGRGKGRCLNQGKGLRNGSGYNNGGRRANFVDANKNGICDRRE